MKFLEPQRQYKLIKKEIDSAIQKVINSGVFVGGYEVEEFEKELARFCGVKYAIGLNSGTSALFLSLKALGIGPGDEVITTPFTFIATVEAIINNSAKPVFVDINSETFNIDVSKIEEKITGKTKALLPVYLFGQKVVLNKRYGLRVIEDACQAIGAKVRGDASCLSFYPTKNLSCFGDGGAVLTNSKRLCEKIRLLRNHGSSSKNKYHNQLIGTNSRLDVLQAAVLRIKLQHLKKWNNARIRLAREYNKLLKDYVIVPSQITPHTYNQYTIRVKNRDKLRKYLEFHKIPTAVYYPKPLHLQPALRYLDYQKGDFPEAEKASKEVLSLPLYPELKKEELELVCQKIYEYYSSN